MNLGALKRKMEAFSRWQIERRILQRVLRTSGRPDVESVGEWFFPTTLLNERSICYCGGVGTNMSIEIGLAARFGCHVWAFDPTPLASRYFHAHVVLPPTLHFVPQGLWSEDKNIPFFLPAPDAIDDVNYSIVMNLGAGKTFNAKCSTIKSIMRELGHDRLDLLKMNIEGAEYEVMRRMLADGIEPAILGVAFEGDHAFRDIFKWGGKKGILAQHGYTFVKFWNYTGLFVKEKRA